MPRPVEFPEWLYPGTQIRDINRQTWMIETITYRGVDGFHIFLSPLGRGVPGWFPVDWVVRRYHPSNPSQHPAVHPTELRDLAYRGLIHVTPAQEAGFPSDNVVVHSIIEDPLELPGLTIPAHGRLLVHCPGWQGNFHQVERERDMMVSFDGAPAMPYSVREVQVDCVPQLVLESIDGIAETDVFVAALEVWNTRSLVPTPAGIGDGLNFTALLTEPEPLEPLGPERRISVWDRLAAERKRGSNVAPGGAGAARRTLTQETTPKDEPGV